MYLTTCDHMSKSHRDASNMEVLLARSSWRRIQEMPALLAGSRALLKCRVAGQARNLRVLFLQASASRVS